MKGILFAIFVLVSGSEQGVFATVHYVRLDSTNPSPPYSDWSTAARSIQLAVDASVHGDTVIVSNGVYRTGGRKETGGGTNRLVISTNWVTVQSLNGPAVTAIEGYQTPGTTNGADAVRCVYMNLGALIGFTLTNGASSGSSGGGGVSFVLRGAFTVVVSNCVLINNAGGYNGGGGAYSDISGGNSMGSLINCRLSGNTAGSYGGGGAYQCLLSNCVLSNNAATVGGGAAGGRLTNCVLVGNSAFQGGGANGAFLYNSVLFRNVAADKGGGAYAINRSSDWMVNCTVASNSAASYGGIYASSSPAPKNCIIYYNTPSNYYPSATAWTNCCTTPSPSNGINNITNEPLLLNLAAGDLRLQSNSPCINAGNNGLVPTTLELDGNSRIAGDLVDMGAYEFQTPGSSLPYWWIQRYGLAMDGSEDDLDADDDHMINRLEWRAGTNPTDPLSVLRLLAPVMDAEAATLTWQSVGGMSYSLERSSNSTAESSFLLLSSNILGKAGTTSFADTNQVGDGPFFYRVRVQ